MCIRDRRRASLFERVLDDNWSWSADRPQNLEVASTGAPQHIGDRFEPARAEPAVLVGSSAGLQCPQAYGELSLEPERHLAGRRFGQAKRSRVAGAQGRQRVVCDPAGLIRDAALIFLLYTSP